MRSERVKTIVEIALCVALAAVLNLPGLRIRLPINIAGGTVSLSMVPIFVLALRRGLIAGIVGGDVDDVRGNGLDGDILVLHIHPLLVRRNEAPGCPRLGPQPLDRIHDLILLAQSDRVS